MRISKSTIAALFQARPTTLLVIVTFSVIFRDLVMTVALVKTVDVVTETYTGLDIHSVHLDI